MDNAIPLKPQVVEILGNRWQVTPRRIQAVSKQVQQLSLMIPGEPVY
jgi:hypothetical protein